MGLDIDSVADSLWAAQQQGRHMPDEWHKKLNLDNAYPVQLAMLRRRLQVCSCVAFAFSAASRSRIAQTRVEARKRQAWRKHFTALLAQVARRCRSPS